MNDQNVSYSVGTVMPTLACKLQAEDGGPIDLTLAVGIELHATDPRTDDVVTKTADVLTASAGTVTVEITPDLTDQVRQWLCRFRITFPSGRAVDVPNEGYLRLNVT